MINGVETVAITKLDVLSTFDELKYVWVMKLDGKQLKSFPTDVERLNEVKPIYESFTAGMKI